MKASAPPEQPIPIEPPPVAALGAKRQLWVGLHTCDTCDGRFRGVDGVNAGFRFVPRTPHASLYFARGSNGSREFPTLGRGSIPATSTMAGFMHDPAWLSEIPTTSGPG